MTRFEMELSGKLGDFWKRNAEKEIARMQERADNGEILIDGNGAAYWATNGNYLPSDCVEKLQRTSFFFDAEATNDAERRQTAEFFEAYCAQKHELSAEDRWEMRDAFGKGATVVDVISGEVYIA